MSKGLDVFQKAEAEARTYAKRHIPDVDFEHLVAFANLYYPPAIRTRKNLGRMSTGARPGRQKNSFNGKGEKAYRERLSGKSWVAVGEAVGIGATTAFSNAKLWALRMGKEWPPDRNAVHRAKRAVVIHAETPAQAAF